MKLHGPSLCLTHLHPLPCSSCRRRRTDSTRIVLLSFMAFAVAFWLGFHVG